MVIASKLSFYEGHIKDYQLKKVLDIIDSLELESDFSKYNYAKLKPFMAKDKKISKGVAFRVNTNSEPKITQETGFHAKTSKLTKNFINYNGYWLANNYTKYGAVKEYTSCRESAIVTDLSPLRKFEILGPDAENLMQYTLTRNVKKLSVGQIVYSAMCYENGMMFDDGTLLRLSETGFRWICGDEYAGEWLKEIATVSYTHLRANET